MDGVDYYALLNVPRSASRDTIKAAYSHLARTLHPDKVRLGAEDQGEAQDLFILVDKAYKVLSSEKHRAVYDAFGHQGIQAMKTLYKREEPSYFLTSETRAWDLLTPCHVALWDERGESLRSQLLLQRELDAVGRFKIRGAFQVNTDARGLIGGAFEPLTEYDHYGPRELSFSMPQVKGVIMQQSMEISVSPKDIISISGQATSGSGRGGHALSIGLDRQFRDTFSGDVTVSHSSMDPLGLSLKANHALGPLAKGTLEFVVKSDGQTGLSVQGARKMTDTTTGVLQLGFGVESGLVLQLNHAERFNKKHVRSKKEQEDIYNKSYYPDNDAVPSFANHAEQDEEDRQRIKNVFFSNGTLAFFLGPGMIGLTTSFARSISSKTRGKIGLKATTAGVELELTSSRVLSAHSKGNVSISVGLQGVKLTYKYERGDLRYVFPFTLSSGLSFGAALIGGLVPISINFLAMRLLQPYYETRQIRDKHEVEMGFIKERSQARMQMIIMRNSIKRNEEPSLVILCARYGQHLHKSFDWRDVQEPVLDYNEGLIGRPRVPSDWDEDDTIEDEEEKQEDMNLAENENGDLFQSHPPNIDVTSQLNFFVKDDRLELHGGVSKAQLLGFYNPCTGCIPELYVKYRLGDWIYEFTCIDIEPVEIPSYKAVLVGSVQK